MAPPSRTMPSMSAGSWTGGKSRFQESQHVAAHRRDADQQQQRQRPPTGSTRPARHRAVQSKAAPTIASISRKLAGSAKVQSALESQKNIVAQRPARLRRRSQKRRQSERRTWSGTVASIIGARVRSVQTVIFADERGERRREIEIHQNRSRSPATPTAAASPAPAAPKQYRQKPENIFMPASSGSKAQLATTSEMASPMTRPVTPQNFWPAMQSSGPSTICDRRCSPGASDRFAYCSSAIGCCRNTIASNGARRAIAIGLENSVASPTQ